MLRSHRIRAATLASLFVALATLPATASAAPRATTSVAASDTATIALDGAASRQLRKAGVTPAATAGATRKGTTVTAPVTAASVTTAAGMTLGGTLTFRKGKRSIAFTGLRTTASPAKVTLTGRFAGVKLVLGSGRTLDRRLTFDAAKGTVRLSASSLTIGSRTAGILKRTFRLKRTPTGTIGTIRLAVSGTTPAVPQPPTTPPVPPVDPAVVDPDPPVVPRPADAVDVSAASIVWHVRDSFVQYTAAGEGSTASNGATADPVSSGCTNSGGVSDAQLRYQFRFTPRSAWYQPSTGRAGLNFTGTVNFRYKAHTIDLNMKNPEIDVNGTASRAIFRLSGSDGTNLGDIRPPLIDLGLTGPKPKQCAADPGPAGIDAPSGVANPDGSRTFTFERMPGTVAPEGAAAVFSDYGYQAGDPFGWMTVTFTVPAA